MSQPQQMSMGGPVGAVPMNAGTPNSGVGALDSVKRLNTAIYDYLLRNSLYDAARSFIKSGVDVETSGDVKRSPNQRQGQQANGVDDSMDLDSHEIKNRPDDLPAPAQLGDGPFLQDWWCQFWEIYQGHRGKGNQKPSTLSYIGAQRQMQKQRTNMMGNMDPASMQNMRGYNQMMQGANNGMGMPNELKRAAITQNQQRNMTPQQMQQLKNMQAAQNNAQLMQGQQMERQGSQMDMSGPRSGSPGSGDAPSPKRQRIEGNMQQQMNQGRPGQPGQMPPGSQVGSLPAPDPALIARTQELFRQQGINPDQIAQATLHNLAVQPANHQAKSVEAYSSSIQQTMKAAMNQANSNMNKGMPPNAPMVDPTVGQGSPLSQTGMDGATGEFYAAANGARLASGMNQAAQQAAQQAAAAAGGQQGNHALQDYQMQLMLLEQQNKKRLLMARQEQDSMAHPVPGANGQFPPGMSPQGSRNGDPSPNPNDMQRGTPNMMHTQINKTGMSPNGEMMAGRGSPQPNNMMNPSMIPPELRQQMMQNPQMMMRPPSSHPGPAGQQMSQEQMQMFQRQGGQMLPNGPWQPGQPGGPGQMMPGQPGQPPPNMTPRQGNMGPPAPPQPNAGTQPSSPSQPPAPPTPSQTSKPKPGTKKAEKAKNAAAKKNAQQTGATPASESEQPPTPTPATPITPMHPNTFGQNKQMPNGQPQPNQPPPGTQPNPPPGQQQQQPPPQPQPQPPADMGPPFGNLETANFDMNMDFAGLEGGDVLDNFDFDSFLNTNDGDGIGVFDANYAFGDGGLEAGGDLGGN